MGQCERPLSHPSFSGVAPTLQPPRAPSPPSLFRRRPQPHTSPACQSPSGACGFEAGGYQGRSRRHRGLKFCRPELPADVSHPTNSTLRSKVPLRGQSHHVFGCPKRSVLLDSAAALRLSGCRLLVLERKGKAASPSVRGGDTRAQSTAPLGRGDTSHGASSSRTSPQLALCTPPPQDQGRQKREESSDGCFTEPRARCFSCHSHHIPVATSSPESLLLII